MRRDVVPVPAAGPVRALDAGRGLWLIASDVEEADYGEAAIASGLKRLDWVSPRAMAHEAVVERFLRAAAVVPMQLFTIFTSDERALAHVARDRRRIERTLARVEGHVEWGLRLTWDEQAARDRVERTHAEKARDERTRSGKARALGRARGGKGHMAGDAQIERGDVVGEARFGQADAPGDAVSPRAGSAYLARKRDLLDVNRTQLAAARAAATAFHERLARQARDVVRRTSTEQAAPGSRLLLDAAYLVRAARGTAFRAAVRQGMRTLADAGIAATLTGPWPPYNFITSR